MNTLYSKILKLSKPITQAYHSDITVHDKATLGKMVVGSLIVWTPVYHGSHLTWVSQPDDTLHTNTLESLRHRLNHFDAVADVFGNADGALVWYMLECTKVKRTAYGHVIKIEAADARELILMRIRDLERALYSSAA